MSFLHNELHSMAMSRSHFRTLVDQKIIAPPKDQAHVDAMCSQTAEEGGVDRALTASLAASVRVSGMKRMTQMVQKAMPPTHTYAEWRGARMPPKEGPIRAATEKEHISIPKAAALLSGEMRSAMNARQMAMDEKAPFKVCTGKLG